MHPEVGGVAGCPDAIKFLRSINASTPRTGGVSAGGGAGAGAGAPPRQRTPQRLLTGNSYTARRAEADAALENLQSLVKGGRPALASLSVGLYKLNPADT
jgi:hypothetical protein